ncbi:MAG: EAL domain-containing protein, partial [Psychromonas sp.]
LDQSNKAIISMIIQLAKSLNMEVIAEGVETESELNCLIELGCYQFQGYYFSRPITFNKLFEYSH